MEVVTTNYNRWQISSVLCKKYYNCSELKVMIKITMPMTSQHYYLLHNGIMAVMCNTSGKK